ncbi:MAG TPA: hypothetical protein VIH71_15150 [Solirubrobacteraceae bacterium]
MQATLDDEPKAAHASPAETEGARQLSGEHLRIALQLAENVAEIYKTDDEQLERSYQAFFKKLYVTPEWDGATGQAVVRITGGRADRAVGPLAGQ